MGVVITTFPAGPLQTNTHLVVSDRQCWIVDPGASPPEMIALIRDSDLHVAAVVLTHGHADHIGGADELRDEFDGAPVICPVDDALMLGDAVANLSQPFGFPLTVRQPEELIRPGQQLSLGESTWQVLDTAGHTPGGVSYYCAEESVVIVGDALFAGSIGRCDLPGSDARRLIDNIRENLLSLPENTHVMTGHGPDTTIAAEKNSNPYL